MGGNLLVIILERGVMEGEIDSAWLTLFSQSGSDWSSSLSSSVTFNQVRSKKLAR